MNLAAAMQVWDHADRVEAVLAERLHAAGYETLRPRWVRLLRWLEERPGWTMAQMTRAGGGENLCYEMRRLEALGLVTPGHHSRDSRIKPYSLTEAGQALLRAVDGEEAAC